MLPITVVILTKNEEKNILDCLESLRDFEELIVIDDYSEDRTIEVIRSYSKKIKVYKRRLNDDFASQRNYGLSEASCEWVLFVDADEIVTPELKGEIERKIKDDKLDGFWIKRKDEIWGRQLRYGEVGGIELVRLGRKMSGKWVGKVHEIWQLEKLGKLESAMIHYPHQSVKEFLSEVNTYSGIRAKELHDLKVNANASSIISYPVAKFFVNYFFKRGFLDGEQGFIVAMMMSFHSFLVRSKLWQLRNR